MTSKFNLALRTASMARCTIRRPLRLGAARVLIFRNAEQNDSRNSELFDFAAFLEKCVNRLLRYARHRTDRISHVFTGDTNIG